MGFTKELLEWIEEYNEKRTGRTILVTLTVETPEPWTNIWTVSGYPDDERLPTLSFIKSTNMDYLRSIEGPQGTNGSG